MNAGRTVFAQLAEHLPHKEFQKCVARYRGDSNPRGFSCWDQYLAMVFAQLTYRESLRDIEACLGAMRQKLYHMGFRGRVARSTLADANDTHDWRIYADFAQVLIAVARPLYAADPIGVELDQSLYALDSTTIDLCLSLFPWARFRRRKAAVKMHNLAQRIGIDRSRFQRCENDSLVRAHAGGSIRGMRVTTLQEHIGFCAHDEEGRFQRKAIEPLEIDVAAIHDIESARLGQDLVEHVHIVHFTVGDVDERGDIAAQIKQGAYVDAETGKRLVFLTNNFALPAATIAAIYKQRWQVELFFKWIKQHLRIKAFYGTSENAVKTQIWIAVSVYVLVAIVRKRLNAKTSLYQILQVFSLTLFEKTPISRALQQVDSQNDLPCPTNQLNLFNL